MGLSRAARFLAVVLFSTAACAPMLDKKPPAPPTAPPPSGPLSLTKASFYHLSGWRDDHMGEVLVAFERSCAAFRKSPAQNWIKDQRFGTTADWVAVCDAARGLNAADHDGVRAFFESRFEPYMAASENNPDGLFTGYFEAELQGAMQRSARYPFPLYERPADMITVRLNQFSPDFDNTTLVGKLDGGSLIPYDNRAQIDAGNFQNRAKPLLWVSDAVDSFFLHIQGSGRVLLENGEVTRVGYAANNGHKFIGIGGVMKSRGLLPNGQGSMQAIRDWLRANPEQAQALMAENPRYIFFRRIDGDGPIGAQGVALTPQRSMAVDQNHLPLGVPLWLETTASDGRPLQRLMIAQDTGAAIKGAVRGDFFWGAGEAALAQAGGMKSAGRYYVLLPKKRQGRTTETADVRP